MAESDVPSQLTGLHLLLTYQCTFECDHCFAWGSPWQNGTFTLANLRRILGQAKDLGTIKWIYFEGGEPFLYYATLLKAVQEAQSLGFQVGIVSNAYWANTLEDAIEWLRPFTGLVVDLSVSSDLYHYDEMQSRQSHNASAAAETLGIPVGTISIAQPDNPDARASSGQIPILASDEGSAIMYRGRAAKKLAPNARLRPWQSFRECSYEDLASPGRLHLDPFGNLHVCQGISLGNLFEETLVEIWQGYRPYTHPITGPLLIGGPAELVLRYGLPHQEMVADACHLCYESRLELRQRFPDYLTPDQMYGAY